MKVVEVDGPGGSSPVHPAHSDLRVEHASAFRGWNGDVDVPRRADRKTGENRIPVMPATPDLDVREIDPVGQMEQAPQEIHLPVTEGALGPLVDLLDEHAVRTELCDRLGDALGAIPTIHPADALMDVVGHHPETHLLIPGHVHGDSCP